MLQVDLKNVYPFVPRDAFEAYVPQLQAAHETLEKGTGAGNDYLGWIRLPETYDRQEFDRLKQAAAKIQRDSQALVVIGIGGSYLGARAVIEYLRSPNYNLLCRDTPQIFFAGNNLSASALRETMALLEGKDWSINVISKSGTTTEPAIAFRLFKELLEKKYGKDGARDRVYATTDRARGALKNLADQEGYQCFVIPDDVGGRYSVLTPVGLLPIAVSGVDIDALMAGAGRAMEALRDRSLENPAWQYAAARNLLLNKGRCTEILACYEPAFRFMSEWWKQLFGESEGKDQKGLFPASVDLTADLHSMGQYIQEGQRNLFETVVHIEDTGARLAIKEDADNLDGLNFLAGRELQYVNSQAFAGTVLAHVDGDVPNIAVHTPAIDAESLGELIYFFEFACGLSGYLLGVNPFNQPGVEAYKKNMFALLGKPGYEELAEKLQKRICE